jgi:hypothetical protein
MKNNEWTTKLQVLKSAVESMKLENLEKGETSKAFTSSSHAKHSPLPHI